MSKCKINNIYNKKINIKYMYYYLKNINDYIDNIFIKGACNPTIDIKNFGRFRNILDFCENLVYDLLVLQTLGQGRLIQFYFLSLIF